MFWLKSRRIKLKPEEYAEFRRSRREILGYVRANEKDRSFYWAIWVVTLPGLRWVLERVAVTYAEHEEWKFQRQSEEDAARMKAAVERDAARETAFRERWKKSMGKEWPKV
jgi:hypothetical protein